MKTLLLAVHICTVIINLYYYFGFRNQAETVWDFLWRIVIAAWPVISQILIISRMFIYFTEFVGFNKERLPLPQFAEFTRNDVKRLHNPEKAEINRVDERIMAMLWYTVVGPIN